MQIMLQIKNSIKAIPLLGRFMRWGYNLLRLNNLKHISFINTQKIKQIEQELRAVRMLLEVKSQAQDKRVDNIDKKIKQQDKRVDGIDEKIKQQEKLLEVKSQAQDKRVDNIDEKIQKHDVLLVNQEKFAHDLVQSQIINQSILFHEKIDEFIQRVEMQPSLQVRLQDEVTFLKEELDVTFMDDFYLEFENKFRGARGSILKRYENYLQFIPEAINKALDIGCGRGEWMQLLQQKEIIVAGCDLNSSMVQIGEQNGVQNLKVEDAFSYLSNTPNGTYDLITSFHVIEHIPFEELMALLKQIKRVSSPNATILLETPNPQNLQVGACNFYIDPTHLNPLPSVVVSFMLHYLGFKDIKVHYLNPSPNIDSLTPLAQAAQDYLVVAKNNA